VTDTSNDRGALAVQGNRAGPAKTATNPVVRLLLHYYPIFILLGLWELVTRLGLVDPAFMPPFSSVMITLFQELFVSHELLMHMGYSLARAGTGFALAAVVGVVLGVLMGRSKAIESFFDPLISVIFPTPKLALFPLMMVFLGIGDASKIALIFLGCFFPIVINTYTGVRSVDKYFIWNARTKGASRFQVLRTVVFPGALPTIFAGLRVATSMAFLMIVASELIASNEGLGYLILYAQRSFNPELMFSGIILVSAMGFIADRLLLALGRWLFSWQEEGDA
jgi:ABC-type nitrate/sulfonate/bicarbonate transport system permease component